MNIKFSWTERIVLDAYISHFIEISISKLLSEDIIKKIKLAITKNFDPDPTKTPTNTKFLFDRATDQKNTIIAFHADDFSQNKFQIFTQKVIQTIQEDLPNLFALTGRQVDEEIGKDTEHFFPITLATADEMIKDLMPAKSGFFHAKANQDKKCKHEPANTDPAAKERRLAPASIFAPIAMLTT